MLDFNWEYGELSVYERKLLFDYVLMYKPKIAFEVGSGHGASTYFICQALIKAGRGLLYTCDIRRKPKPIVFKECKDYVQYFKKSSERTILYLKARNIKPNFIFFDGPPEPEIAMNDFLSLEDYIKKGTVFCMHDWGEEFTKAQLLRPYLTASKKWEILFETDVCDGENASVGMVFAKKIQN